MTDLKDLLDQAAGSAPAVTDTQVAADLGRARLAARRRRVTRIGLTAGTTALTIAALAVPLVLSNGSGANVAAPPDAVASARPTTTLSASDVLLAAAAKQENVQASTGKYFRVRSVNSTEWTVTPDGKLHCCGSAPAPAGGYKLRELTIIERWTGLKGGTAWVGERSLGMRPATAADEAAWRKAGAPATWSSGPTDTVDKRVIRHFMKPGKGSLAELKREADHYPTLGLGAGLQDVLALPTTQADLRKKLLEVADNETPSAAEVSALSQISAELLSSTPALPKVRAAVFRLLAELDGAKVTPNVTDATGRKGTAVDFSFPAYGQEKVRMIIDPTTGKLLSSGHTGGKNREVTIMLSGWTDETPQVPPASVK